MQVPSWVSIHPAYLLLGACRGSLSTAVVLLGFAAKLSSFIRAVILVTSVADLLPGPGACVFLPRVSYEPFLGVI